MGGPGERAVQGVSPSLPIPTSHTPICKVGRVPPSTIGGPDGRRDKNFLTRQ